MMNVRHVMTLFVCAVGCFGQAYGVISTLNNNDPLPLYYTHTPHDYLTAQIKRALRQPCIDQPCYDEQRPYDRFLFSIGGLYQKASRGKNFELERVPLGDLAGRWHMLGMLYGKVPPPFTLVDTQLGCAKQIIFSDLERVVDDVNAEIPNKNTIEHPNRVAAFSDPNQLAGYFSVPIKYRKEGFRFALEFALLPCGELGIGVYGGAASIKQTVTNLIDLTPDCVETLQQSNLCMDTMGTSKAEIVPDEFLDITPTGTRICNIRDQLMDPCKAEQIFIQICQDPCDFKDMSFEDLHILFWWRHLYHINDCDDPCYPAFTIMPFATFQLTVPLAKEKDRTQLYSLPFGNDGHFALAGTAGFSIDFNETLEIGFSGGVTHFFAKDFKKFRVPTHEKQSGIFPFYTDVSRKPGRNIMFDAHLTAHHFICLLSMWVQYAFVCHNEDKIFVKSELARNDYKPEVLECVTKWESQMLNTGATYDISPNIALGVVAQWPLQQRNAYRSTSFLGTIQVEF